MAKGENTGKPTTQGGAYAAVKMPPPVKVRDIDWFVNQIRDTATKAVCKRLWVLGAGASVESGIPGAAYMARKWFQERHICKTPTGPESDCKACAQKNQLSGDFANDYFRIYNDRFEGDRRGGYAEILELVDGKAPSYGYLVLAELMRVSTSKTAVTVNFDNLLVDALHLVTNRSVQVLGHEKVADCIRYDWGTPVVCKIHRDLTMQPMNTPDEMGSLSEPWIMALGDVLKDHSPIFIGYGGNDRSLMGFLDKYERELPAAPIWLEFDRDGTKQPGSSLAPNVIEFLDRTRGVVVQHPGFDYLFKQVQLAVLPNFDPIAAIEVYASSLVGSLTASLQETAENVNRVEAQSKSLKRRLSQRKVKSLDDFLFLAAAATTSKEKIEIYEEAISQFEGRKAFGTRLERSRLANNLGHVYYTDKEFARASEWFGKAVAWWPEYSRAHYNRACCRTLMNELQGAFEDLSESIRLDPSRKERARNDPDFELIAGTPTFKRLTQD